MSGYTYYATICFQEDEDPRTFKSAKTGRGPLTAPDWKNHVDPVMTCYKLVSVEFKWWGLQVRPLTTTKKTSQLFGGLVFIRSVLYLGLELRLLPSNLVVQLVKLMSIFFAFSE